jgi:hypothetical protein
LTLERGKCYYKKVVQRGVILLSILTVEKVITVNLKLNEEQVKTLYGLFEKCLRVGWDWHDQETNEKFEFCINQKEDNLLESVMNDIEKSEILNNT